jgi:hypothetical protein
MVMSKERELLNKAIEMIQIVPMMASIGNVPPDFGSELILEIQKLLDQPEEGVYQKILRIEDGIEVEILPSELWLDGYETGRKDPPKRKPLSYEEITDLWANKAPTNEFECVRLVEKAHGIGGGG